MVKWVRIWGWVEGRVVVRIKVGSGARWKGRFMDEMLGR